MKADFSTERLLIKELSLDDSEFILELVNTAGWKKFIGDRNVESLNEADHYIQRMIADIDINYWVVKLKDHFIPVGIITLIKREYLKHYE